MEKLEQLEFDIHGMTCDSCALHVERALEKIEGVREAEIPGWESGHATVTVEGSVDGQDLVTAVKQAGYGASLKTRQPIGLREQPEEGHPGNGHGDGRFDLMVIGGGSAGFAAAIKGAELGYRVALVEANTIGGTCVNVGCVPSKTLIRAMEQYHQAGTRRFQGVETAAGHLNWPEVIAHKDELVAVMRQSKYIDVLAGYPEITYIQGRARLTGSKGVNIDGRPYAPGKIVITTGAQPWAPPIPGLPGSGYLTSTTAMELKELPRSMIVLGANAVGLELVQTFARAGTHVTLLELFPRIAPFEDEEIGEALQGYLEEEGLEILTGFQTSQVEEREGRYILTGTQDGQDMTFDTEQLLVATGRRPNTQGMGLEEAGVKLGQRGEILVDERLQTNNPNVYAAGDVTGQDMFVYVAAYGGGLAAENALTEAGRVYDASYIPRITFTDPQIASAGLTEEQARQQGYDVRVSSLPMTYVPRALAARDTRGLIKLVADGATDRLLGAHILAPEAGEMIQTAVLAIRFGITLTQLRQTMFPYLTNVEGIKLAALAFEKDVAMLSCCAG
ncbi:MAG TPA: mercury(II) reductase [Anaerolineales bacterium]